MKAENWEKIREAFHAAVDLPPEKRNDYLDQTCPDAAVRHEVESLLDAHSEAGDRLDDASLKLAAVGTLVHSDDPWIGTFIGPYQVIAPIGRGGMGAVYRAVRVEQQYIKQVAIKLLRPGLGDDSYQRRFMNERQIMAVLDHPNIARLLDVGAIKGLPYYVMEYIEGEHIDAYCDHRQLTTRARLELFLQVCSAVQYAHQHLIVHRDLKPQNILITTAGTPKLLDFGIAKPLDPEIFLQTTALTVSNIKPMTPEFASPEQIRGGPITISSDVYSLGVLLYRLLTGHSPHGVDVTQLHELVRAISDAEPLRPSLVIDRVTQDIDDAGRPIELSPDTVSKVREGHVEALRHRLKGDLDNILLKALRKEPERRYGSVEQFAEDIHRHLDGRPVIARKDTIRYRTVKFAQRHKAAVAAAVLLVLSLIGGIVATSWQAHIARVERAKAERRFNDVRHLTNALIFDMEGAISELPKSTAARKLLLDNALKYLDSLARESKGDAGLQRELASAYKKLGDVQGYPFQGNMGDTAGALESYRKVVEIRQALVAENPDDKQERHALAEGYRVFGQMQITSGNLVGALSSANKALSIMEPLAKSYPDEFKILDELESAYELIGDIQGGNGASANLGDLPGALENHGKALAVAQQALRLFPDDPAAQRAVAIYELKIGEDQVEQGDRSLGVENYRKGLEVYKALAAKSDNPRLTRDMHLIYTRIGNAYLMEGKFRDAIENYRAALEILKQTGTDTRDALARVDFATTEALVGQAIAEAGDRSGGLAELSRAISSIEHESVLDPMHVEINRALGLLYVWRGQILARSGKFDAALADYRKTASIFGKIISADPQDADTSINLAAANTKIADTLVSAGDLIGALDAYRRAIAVAELHAHSVPPNVLAQYTVADAYSGMGNTFLHQAMQSRTPGNRVKQFTEAREWFQKSFQEWKQVRNPGVMSPGGFDTAGPSFVSQKIAECDAKLKEMLVPERAAP